MRSYPALDVTGADAELVMAAVDDFSPSAVEELGATVSIYFSDPSQRDGAADAVRRAFPAAALSSREVDDEDWARRSQENLKPITVGRVTVAPPWAAAPAPGFGLQASGSGLQSSGRTPSATADQHPASSIQPLSIVILPSMGFGTGHHSTTRLCLAALQTLDLAGREVLDVGTGSGVLAIAASRLGASAAVGLDYDVDAIQSADDNLALNPEASGVRFQTIDLRAEPLPSADVITANLTGVLLVESAALLMAPVRPGGSLIVSGLQTHERVAVEAAFSSLHLAWSEEETGWVGLIFNRSALPTV